MYENILINKTITRKTLSLKLWGNVSFSLVFRDSFSDFGFLIKEVYNPIILRNMIIDPISIGARPGATYHAAPAGKGIFTASIIKKEKMHIRKICATGSPMFLPRSLD